MENEIIEGNKLIAEFMGAVYSPDWRTEIYINPCENLSFKIPPTDNSSYNWTPQGLQYHSSWSWLMPVVEKIEQFDFIYRVVIANKYCEVEPQPGHGYLNGKKEESKIISVWLAVIEFIKWYNSQTKP